MKQSIYEASTRQLYPIGKRIAMDERVFRYCHAHAAIAIGAIPAWGAANKNTFEESAVCVNNQAVGDITVVLTCQRAGGVALNEFQGGYIGYGGVDTGRAHTVRVRSNTAALAANDTFVVRLEHGLPGTMTGGATTVTCYANPFSNVAYAADVTIDTRGFAAIVGVPLVDIVGGSYGWLQTWGPIHIVGTAAYGVTIYNIGLVFNGADGSTHIGDAAGTWPAMQFAGFMLPCSHWAAVGHDSNQGNFINLMIFP